MNTLTTRLLTGVFLFSFSFSIYAQCSFPAKSAAQLAETGDQFAISQLCKSNDSERYMNLFNIRSSDWDGYGSELLYINYRPQLIWGGEHLCDRPEEIDLPLQRLLAAAWALEKSRFARGRGATGPASPALDDFFKFAQYPPRPRPACYGATNVSAVATARQTLFHVHALFNNHVVVRAATMVHERAHFKPTSKPHLGGMKGDVTIIHRGRTSCDNWDLCDPDWDYNGAWTQEVIWHDWYSVQGGVYPSMGAKNGRRIAEETGNWVLTTKFVITPYTSSGQLRTVSCYNC